MVHDFFIPFNINFETFYEDYEDMIDTIIDSDVRIIIVLTLELDL